MSVVDSLADGLESVGETISDTVDGAVETVKGMTTVVDSEFVFIDFQQDIEKIVDIVTGDLSAGLYEVTATIISNIYSVVMVIGLNLAVLFFLISFLKKSVMFEFVNWENVVKTILLLFVAKFFIQNAAFVLEGAYDFITDAIKQLQASLTLENEAFAEQVNESIELIKKSYSEGLWGLGKYNPLNKLTFLVRYAPVFAVMGLIKGLIYVVAYGRIIEIYLHQCIAPIPLATLVSEDLSHVAVKFLKSYVGVCVQGLIIVVVCYIYQGLMLNWMSGSLAGGEGNTELGIGGLLVCSLTFGFIIWKSGDWGKRITGAM
jgi:hypothetical protein